jgi:hypothetical protein
MQKLCFGSPCSGGKSLKKCVQPTSERDFDVSNQLTKIWLPLAAAAAVAALAVFIAVRHWRPEWTTIQGAVIRQDADSHKELPVSDVLVTASRGTTSLNAHSDASGYFKVEFPGVIWPGQVLDLNFSNPGYEPLDIKIPIRFRSTTKQLIVAAMTPIPLRAENETAGTQSAVSNIKVRYTVNSQSEENIGSAVKIFQVVNQGNVPCRREPPCSPDSEWKASTGSAELDAGVGNEFRDARASCIAGPCPFTRINSSGFVHGGRIITASAVDWSDTATFLLEAEVFHTGIISNVRESYPVIFGRTFQFTLPPTQEGISLEAELNGAPMVFPLGPDLYLSWATCTARTSSESDKSTVYQCELKPGYRF